MVDTDKIIWEAARWNFDLYRQLYGEMTFSERKIINDGILKTFPSQNRSDKKFFVDSFKIITDSTGSNIKVFEVGGYDGALAKHIMDIYPTVEWDNYDIFNAKPVDGLEKYKYKIIEIDKPFWEYKDIFCGYNVFVSSDTIEHMNEDEFLKTVSATSCVEYEILQIDTRTWKTDWKGDGSTHVLTTIHDDLDLIYGGKKVLHVEPIGREWKRLLWKENFK